MRKEAFLAMNEVDAVSYCQTNYKLRKADVLG